MIRRFSGQCEPGGARGWAALLLGLLGASGCSVPPPEARRPNPVTAWGASERTSNSSGAGGVALSESTAPTIEGPLDTSQESLSPDTSPCSRDRGPPTTPVRLPVPGFRPSVVMCPTEIAVPWLLAAHGAGDSADAQCEYWRELLGPRQGVVLCPAGVPIHRDGTQGDFFPDHRALQQEVRAAVEASGAEPEGSVVYVGYSQGATMGALMLPEEARTFPRVLLIEGGYAEWDARRASQFHQAGGARVALVCGTRVCAKAAERSRTVLRAAGVDSRVWSELRAGHSYGGLLTAPTLEALDWLLAVPHTERTAEPLPSSR